MNNTPRENASSSCMSYDFSFQSDDGRECLKQFKADSDADSDEQCSFGDSQSRRIFGAMSASLHDVEATY